LVLYFLINWLLGEVLSGFNQYFNILDALKL
jgi:hypothetical protein